MADAAGSAGGNAGATQSAGQAAAENVTNKVMGQPQTPQPAGGDAGSLTSDAAQAAMRKFKVKVDNQDMEVDEGELIKGYTHGRAAAKRMQEGTKAKQQAEAFLNMMKDKGSLFDTIKKLGHDPRALAEEYLAAQIQEELMDPKDRELKNYQAKIKFFEEQEAKRKDDTAKAEHERLKTKFAKEFETAFIDALKTSGLPQTKPMVAEMAKYIKRAADIGYQLTPQDAAKLVREDEQARVQSVAGETEAEALARLLGEPTLQKLRAWDAQRLKNPQAGLNTPTAQGERQKRDKSTGRMTPKEWRMFNKS